MRVKSKSWDIIDSDAKVSNILLRLMINDIDISA